MHLLVIRDCNHSECMEGIIWKSYWGFWPSTYTKISDKGKTCIKVCTLLSDWCSWNVYRLCYYSDTLFGEAKHIVSGKTCIGTYIYRIVYKYIKLHQSGCKMSKKTSKHACNSEGPLLKQIRTHIMSTFRYCK